MNKPTPRSIGRDEYEATRRRLTIDQSRLAMVGRFVVEIGPKWKPTGIIDLEAEIPAGETFLPAVKVMVPRNVLRDYLHHIGRITPETRVEVFTLATQAGKPLAAFAASLPEKYVNDRATRCWWLCFMQQAVEDGHLAERGAGLAPGSKPWSKMYQPIQTRREKMRATAAAVAMFGDVADTNDRLKKNAKAYQQAVKADQRQAARA